MSLYRKYRPQDFDNLVGQDHVKITLINALKTGRVSHAYLFTGPRGTGKTSSARILAKAVNCLDLQEAKPCEKCEICNDINEGRLIDLIEIDAASNRGIDEIRDLKEKINFAPTRARAKVYIIDEVHMLTKEAFNALLKTLEEPPAHVYFILATTEVHKIPETILSRCQRFDFKRIEDHVLVDRLKYITEKEAIQADPQALEVIAHIAQGGARDAIGLLEQLTTDGELRYQHVSSILGLSGFAAIEAMYGYLLQKDMKSALNTVQTLYNDGVDLTQFTKTFLNFLRKKMLTSVESGKSGETAWILSLIELFQKAHDEARFAVITQLPLEMAVIASCLPGHSTETAENETNESVEKSTKQTVENKTAAPPQEVLSQKAVPVPDNEEKPSGKITLEMVKAVWPRVVERITQPVVKRTISEAVLSRVEGATIFLQFINKFTLDKIMEPVNRHEIENVCGKALSIDVKIAGELHKSTGSDDLANQLADFFQGEVV